MKRNLYLLSLMLIQSCVGVGVVSTKHHTTNYDSNDNATKESIIQNEKPKTPEIKKIGDRDTLIYEDSQMCGVFFVFVPLMLPVCDASTTYLFKNGALVQKDTADTDYHGVFCSIFPMEGKGLCTTD